MQRLVLPRPVGATSIARLVELSHSPMRKSGAGRSRCNHSATERHSPTGWAPALAEERADTSATTLALPVAVTTTSCRWCSKLAGIGCPHHQVKGEVFGILCRQAAIVLHDPGAFLVGFEHVAPVLFGPGPKRLDRQPAIPKVFRGRPQHGAPGLVVVGGEDHGMEIGRAHV